MLTGEISQDMLGGYNKTVLQYANKGLAQNMVSQGGGWYDMWNYVNDATGYRVINTGLIPITESSPLTTFSPGAPRTTSPITRIKRACCRWWLAGSISSPNTCA
jgi:hypothetical protein